MVQVLPGTAVMSLSMHNINIYHNRIPIVFAKNLKLHLKAADVSSARPKQLEMQGNGLCDVASPGPWRLLALCYQLLECFHSEQND